jgi:hypothetical protein
MVRGCLLFRLGSLAAASRGFLPCPARPARTGTASRCACGVLWITVWVKRADRSGAGCSACAARSRADWSMAWCNVNALAQDAICCAGGSPAPAPALRIADRGDPAHPPFGVRITADRWATRKNLAHLLLLHGGNTWRRRSCDRAVDRGSPALLCFTAAERAPRQVVTDFQFPLLAS